MSNPLLDIRIGTMVRGNLADPAAYVRAILPLGFESIQPFFWQTIGDKDIPRLAGEIREAIGDADVKVGALGMFGNPLEDQPLDRETLAGWETLIDNAHLFGTDIVAGFTGRLRGRPLPESLPRFREVWGPLARRAADRGVRIAFENCAMEGNWASGDWNIAHNPDAWEMMFDALPDENVGLEWEPCHQMVYLIDPIPQIREWAPRIFHVHGKDATVRWDVIRRHGIFGKHRFVEMRTPGFGDSDWARVIGDLRLAGYRGSIDIEGWHDPGLPGRPGADRAEAGARLPQGMPWRHRLRPGTAGGAAAGRQPESQPREDRHANQDAHGRNSGHRGAARARECCGRAGAARGLVQGREAALLRRRGRGRRLRHHRLQRRAAGGCRHRRGRRLRLLRLVDGEDGAAAARGGRRQAGRHRDDGPPGRCPDHAAGRAGLEGRHQDDVPERAGARRSWRPSAAATSAPSSSRRAPPWACGRSRTRTWRRATR